MGIQIVNMDMTIETYNEYYHEKNQNELLLVFAIIPDHEKNQNCCWCLPLIPCFGYHGFVSLNLEMSHL